jgi:hypothetical protein
MGSEDEPVASATDLFGDAYIPPVVVRRNPFRLEPVRLRPTPVRLVGAFAAGVLLSYLFDIWFPWNVLYVAGAVASQATRGRRRLQLTVGVATTALFFTFGCPLMFAAFAPPVRYVFFGVIAGSAVALFEWAS